MTLSLGMAVANRVDIQEQKGVIKRVSLKSKTREDCTSGMQIQYKIEDDTSIENIASENFLSHFNAKRDLTKYLSSKIAQVLSAAGKRYVVVYTITVESNIVDFPGELKFHSHQKAGTLIVLQSIDVAKSNPFCQLYVACSDTDSSCSCTFTRRYVIILYSALLHERLMLDMNTMH